MFYNLQSTFLCFLRSLGFNYNEGCSSSPQKRIWIFEDNEEAVKVLYLELLVCLRIVRSFLNVHSVMVLNLCFI